VPAAAQVGAVAVNGSVLDRSSGLPLAGASVIAVGTKYRTTADANGSFAFTLPPGIYTFQATSTGYETQQTDSVAIVAGNSTAVTLSLQRAQNSSSGMKTIGHSSARANDALQPATVIQHTVIASDQLAQGTVSAVNALKDLPNVNLSTGISAPGIDVSVTLRGLGAQQLIDGHPTMVALNSVALFPFQTINVVYGSGKGELYPTNAIGGVIDFRTISPTLLPHTTFTQGFGTFGHLTTAVNTTGTVGKLGYAFSFGTEGVQGPYAPTTRYQPRDGWDPSATSASVAARNTVSFNAPFSVKSEFAKLSYAISPAITATATILGSAQVEDNAGNKSIDYFPYSLALTQAQQKLAGKKPSDPCPPGSFTATNFKGVPYGTGPNGENDGGQPCQTPASYASLNSGYSTGELGSIATNNNDNDVKVVVEGQHYRFVVDAYASIFKRSQLYQSSQYQVLPGDLNGIHTKQTHDSEAGFTVTDDLIFKNDDIQLGYYTNNYRQDELGWQFDQNHKATGNYLFTYGNDIQSVFARLVHHSVNSPLSFYFTDYIKNSQQPNAWFNDPRVAVLYRKGNNTFRVAAGVSSALPYAPNNATYQPTPIAQFSSGVQGRCNQQNSIGNAPAGFTKPERASDEEVSFAHRWSGDSTTQLELYAENFASQVQYGTNAPLTYTGTGFLSPAMLAAYEQAYANACGVPVSPAILQYLTLQGNYNLGRVLVQGIDLTGRQRLSRRLFVDYEYGIESNSYRSLPQQFIVGSKTTIVGTQVPGIPLQNGSLALDYTAPNALHVRLQGYYQGRNNQYGLPAFTRTDLTVNKDVNRHATVTVYVRNLLQYKAFYDQIDNSGIAYPLNAYASSGDYTPYFGAGSTNLYGIGPRTINLNLAVRY
jgi:outer membrane receptor protein involved in Fe transport